MFDIFGLPLYIHSDYGLSFIFKELKQYLKDQEMAANRFTTYRPTGNAERQSESNCLKNGI